MFALTQPVQIKTIQIFNRNMIEVMKAVSDKFEIRNFGRDPALDVASHVMMVDPPPTDAIETQKQIANDQDAACKTADRDAISGTIRGVVVFPNATAELADILNITMRAVPSAGFNHSQETNSDGILMIVGCISYRDTFQNLHHTRMCFISDDPISKLSTGSKLRLCHGSQEAD